MEIKIFRLLLIIFISELSLAQKPSSVFSTDSIFRFEENRYIDIKFKGDKAILENIKTIKILIDKQQYFGHTQKAEIAHYDDPFFLISSELYKISDSTITMEISNELSYCKDDFVPVNLIIAITYNDSKTKYVRKTNSVFVNNCLRIKKKPTLSRP